MILPRDTFFSGFSSLLISPLQPNQRPPAALRAPNTPTARPPALAFLSSGGAMRLETTTKRPIMISPVVLRYLLLLLVSDVRYPLPDAGDIFQPPSGNGFTRSNLDRHALGLVYHPEPGLVGQVIPKKTGVRPLNGASAINAAMAAPLLIPAGLISTTHLPGCNASSGWASATLLAIAKIAAS